MNYQKFIKTQDVEIGGRKFAISRIPAIDALPIKNVVMKSILDNGVAGIMMLPIQTVRSILSFTAMEENGEWFELDSENRVNRAFESGEVLDELVIRMVKENFGFLITGNLLDLLADEKAETESAS